MKKIATLVLMMGLASGAFAHSSVETTTPADGTTVATVPDEIGLSFTKDIRLTRVEIAHEEHPPVQLDLGDQTSFERLFTIPIQGSGTGTYLIEWRGLGADGHVMQGEFSFTVE